MGGGEPTDGLTARRRLARFSGNLSGAFSRATGSVAVRRIAVVALAGLLALSVYGTWMPAGVRCSLPGAVGCAGGLLGPALAPAGSGEQWFDVTMYDWGFWIVDSTTGQNESNDWTVFEGWTVHVNATSLPPDVAVGGTAYHGLGVEINATGQQLLSLAAPVGRWVTATFVAPTTAYYHQHIWCTIQCGPGHGSQQAHILNVVPGVVYPVATASANTTSGPAPLAIQLTGNGTTGAPPYNYSWSFGDGPGVAYGNVVRHLYSLGGVYYATLTVTDSKGNAGRATVTITVLSNAPLESSLTAALSAGVAPFAASLSVVTHGGTPPYRYVWSFGDGPNVSGSNATVHVYDSPGVYAASVEVVDSVGVSVRALTLVTVNDPTGTFALAASASPANGSVPEQTTLNATASGGTAPYTFSWVYGDGATGSGASTTHLYNRTGSYEATVFASDAADRTAVANVRVVVTALNSSGGDGGGGGDSVPAAAAPAASPLTVRIVDSPSRGGAPLSIEASASIAGGTGLSEVVNWSFGDGSTGSGQVVTHTFSSLGVFNVTVSATDSNGSTGSNSTEVRVGPLAVEIVANETVGDSPFSVTVATTITGGTGAYGNVTWSWGDGQTGTGDFTSHTYGPNLSGPVTLTARVADSAGAISNATLALSVRGPPSASISVTRGPGAGVPVTVTFGVTVVGGSGGYASDVLWTFGDLSGTRGPTIVNHTYNRTGHFLVTVETNDSSGRIALAQTWVNLSSVPATLPSGTSQPWIFTGVPNPQAAALALLGIVAATGLAFLWRKRTGRSRNPRAGGPSGPTAPASGRVDSPSRPRTRG